jgi:hypothetical protein
MSKVKKNITIAGYVEKSIKLFLKNYVPVLPSGMQGKQLFQG